MEPEGEQLRRIDKINILLKEYDTLRAEVLARKNSRFAFVGLISGVAVLLLSRDGEVSWTLTAITILALCLLWAYIGHLIYRLSKGIQRVEAQVNALAEVPLLQWEARSRSFTRIYGYIDRLLNRP